MQKYLSPIINCRLCCMNWYSWGVIRSSHRILRPDVAATVRMHCDAVLSPTATLLMKTVIENNLDLDLDCGKTSVISKILFQLGEMMKTFQHQVKHSYHSNMSTVLKLGLKY